MTANTPSDRRLLPFIAIFIAALSFALFWKASVRHLHIDEPHNVFTMQLVMAWQDPGAGNPVDLHHVLGGLITSHLPEATSHYLVLRILFAALFIATMLGVGFARPVVDSNQERRIPWVLSWRHLAPASIALSMGSAWLHGFEIRHDLFQACGLVAFAWLIRLAAKKPYDWRGRWLAALIVVIMQLTSHKAFTLWVPALLLLAFTAGRHEEKHDRFLERLTSTLRELCRMSIPCVLVGAAGFGILAFAGALTAYLDKLQDFVNYSASSGRFSPLPVIRTMLLASPVAALLAMIAFGAALIEFLRGLKGSIPRALDKIPCGVVLLSICMLALAVNPKPYSYNLVWVSAGLALAAAEGLQWVLGRWQAHRTLILLLLMTASAGQLVPVSRSLWFSLSMNEQMRTVVSVEALTRPNDKVLDGTGLVSSRQAPSRHWLLHSLFMDDYRRHPSTQIASIVQRAFPPVVVLGHYRWQWTEKKDREAVAMWYRPISPTLWVLGYDLDSPQNRAFEIKRAGRYEVAGATQLNGQTTSGRSVHQLSEGVARISGPGRVSIRWIGPELNSFEEAKLPKTRQLYLRPSAALIKWSDWIKYVKAAG